MACMSTYVPRLLTAFRFQLDSAIQLLVRFHLRSRLAFQEIAQSDSMIRMSYHVQDVLMQIVQDGDEVHAEKMIDGDARLFHFRSFGHAKDATVLRDAQSMRSNDSSAPTLLPAY